MSQFPFCLLENEMNKSTRMVISTETKLNKSETPKNIDKHKGSVLSYLRYCGVTSRYDS